MGAAAASRRQAVAPAPASTTAAAASIKFWAGARVLVSLNHNITAAVSALNSSEMLHHNASSHQNLVATVSTRAVHNSILLAAAYQKRKLHICVYDAGIPQTDTLRFYEGFVASFDSRLRNPKWVLEYITKDSIKGEGNR